MDQTVKLPISMTVTISYLHGQSLVVSLYSCVGGKNIQKLLTVTVAPPVPIHDKV